MWETIVDNKLTIVTSRKRCGPECQRAVTVAIFLQGAEKAQIFKSMDVEIHKKFYQSNEIIVYFIRC
jgi:hypothetical protein